MNPKLILVCAFITICNAQYDDVIKGVVDEFDGLPGRNGLLRPGKSVDLRTNRSKRNASDSTSSDQDDHGPVDVGTSDSARAGTGCVGGLTNCLKSVELSSMKDIPKCLAEFGKCVCGNWDKDLAEFTKPAEVKPGDQSPNDSNVSPPPNQAVNTLGVKPPGSDGAVVGTGNQIGNNH